MEKYCERLDTLSNTVDNLSSKLDLVESSLVVTKPVKDNLLNRITTLEVYMPRNIIAEESVLNLLTSQFLLMIKSPSNCM